MKFEYDTKKSKINKQKHGIGFEEAKTLFVTDNVVLPAISKGEKRQMVIGKIDLVLYSCIFTIRDKNIRIISCRRSREKEKGIYYGKIKRDNYN